MQELEKVIEQIERYVSDIDDTQTTQLFKLLNNGKMLRSKLILKIANTNEESTKVCAVVEMIHSASLLHDDVLDESDTRRGKPTINALFDNKTSIMLGDILYSKAFTELTMMNKKVAYEIASAVTKLSVGELLDIELAKSFNSDYDKYFDMIYKKTASLIEASAKSAAILGGFDEEKFSLYGKNLGLAFQMIDDILDITMSSEVLGKPAMQDLKEGKVTIPYILLWQRLENKKQLENLYKKELTKDETQWLMQQLKSTGALEDSIKIAKKIGLDAIEAIKEFKNNDLTQIMNDMIQRDF